MHVRVCRDCGEEYRPEIAVCADCGGVLTDSDAQESSPRAPESERLPLPDLSGYCSVFQTREPRDLRAAAEALGDAGLAFNVVESRAQNEDRRSILSIHVREEDASSALRALAPLHGPEAVAYAERPENDSSCPACETTVPAGAPECPQAAAARRIDRLARRLLGIEPAAEPPRLGTRQNRSEHRLPAFGDRPFAFVRAHATSLSRRRRPCQRPFPSIPDGPKAALA